MKYITSCSPWRRTGQVFVKPLRESSKNATKPVHASKELKDSWARLIASSGKGELRITCRESPALANTPASASQQAEQLSPRAVAHCKGPLEHLLTIRYACWVPRPQNQYRKLNRPTKGVHIILSNATIYNKRGHTFLCIPFVDHDLELSNFYTDYCKLLKFIEYWELDGVI